MQRQPPTRYDDLGDIIPVWRRDGQRILCAGSRYWTDRTMIYNVLVHYHNSQFIDYIIEGEANGADTLSASVARSLDIPVMDFPADWQAYGRAAGPIRNRQMIEQGFPTCAILFHDNINESKGTRNMMLQLKEHHIPFEIIHH